MTRLPRPLSTINNPLGLRRRKVISRASLPPASLLLPFQVTLFEITSLEISSSCTCPLAYQTPAIDLTAPCSAAPQPFRHFTAVLGKVKRGPSLFVVGIQDASGDVGYEPIETGVEECKHYAADQ